MKNKKILCIFVLVFAFLLLGITKSEATLKLNNLNFDAQINEDGSMNVTETWNIYISETNTLFKTFKKDSSRYSEITDVSVKEITSGRNKEFSEINREMYHVTEDCFYALDNSKGRFEIAWGVWLDNSSATRCYQISYKVKDAIAKYNDYAELYWQFLGDEFDINATKINGTILLPANAQNTEDIRVWGHIKGLNGEIYATDSNKIEFTINNYSKRNYVEIRSLFPNDMIKTTNRQYNYDVLDNVLKEETKWANDANRTRTLNKATKYTIICVVVALTTVLTIVFLKKLFKKIKLLKSLDKKFKPTMELDYYRELPYEDATPAEALFIMSKGNIKGFANSFAANILDLCLKQLITLEVEEKGGFFKSDVVKIRITGKGAADLKEDQKITLRYLREVAKGSDELTINDITQYIQAHPTDVQKLNRKVEEAILEQEEQNGNYDKIGAKNSYKYMEKGVIYLFFTIFTLVLVPVALVLLANAIVLWMISSRINKFTQKAVDEEEQWKAFKKYMEDFSLLKEKEVPSLVLWEKYLVFATAFGISDKVLKQLKVVYPEITDMNDTFGTYSYLYIMNRVNIGGTINSAVNSAVSSAISSTYSSGSGGGGGFSGGGGGGRWPEAEVADANF